VRITDATGATTIGRSRGVADTAEVVSPAAPAP
jgi:hypothetical protein